MNSVIALNSARTSGGKNGTRGRKSYWKTRSEKLQERLSLEQEFYSKLRQGWAIEEEIYAERRLQLQLNERAALAEREFEPGTIGISSSALPIVLGLGVTPSGSQGIVN